MSSVVAMSSEIKAKDLQTMLSGPRCPVLVDVRSGGEFRAGHIAGSVNVPLQEVGLRKQEIPVDRPVVLVCQAGTRAEMARQVLAGYHSDIYVLRGGTKAWASAGNVLVRQQAARWSLERQVRLIAGMLVLIGCALSLLGSRHWLLLAGLVGAGLAFAGLTDICGMGIVLSRMPWNRAQSEDGNARSAG